MLPVGYAVTKNGNNANRSILGSFKIHLEVSNTLTWKGVIQNMRSLFTEPNLLSKNLQLFLMELVHKTWVEHVLPNYYETND